jgi:hypothetical protein
MTAVSERTPIVDRLVVLEDRLGDSKQSLRPTDGRGCMISQGLLTRRCGDQSMLGEDGGDKYPAQSVL